MPAIDLRLTVLPDRRLALTCPGLPGWSTVGRRGADLPRMVDDAWQAARQRRIDGAAWDPGPERPSIVAAARARRRGRKPLGRPIKSATGLPYRVLIRLRRFRAYTLLDDGSVLAPGGKAYHPTSLTALNCRAVLDQYAHIPDEDL